MMAWHGLGLGPGLDIDAWLVDGLDTSWLDIIGLGLCCEWTLYLVVVEGTEHQGMN
jgi:hypothetical protein